MQKEYICKQCEEKFNSRFKNAYFCSEKCSGLWRWEQSKIKIEKGEKVHPRTLKKYLIEKLGAKCQNPNCGWDWNKFCDVETEHIDGDSDNNKPINLTLLCPNCHSNTPTYKAKNKGNGRHYRRVRYIKGKSY